MKSIAHLVLFSTSLLAFACTKQTDTAVPATGPAVKQPASPGASAPATPSPTGAKAPAAVAAPSVADLGKLLGGIKDATTAEAAKGPLETIAQQLQTAKSAVPAATATDALGGLGKLAGDAAAKLGVSADTVKQIATLLDNPSVKAVIGPTLEKLQGLLK